MGKVNGGGEFLRHRHQIVLPIGAVGAGAQCKSIAGRGLGRKQGARIPGGGNDARQAEDRKGRIVGMYRKPNPLLLRHGHDFGQKREEIGAEVLDGNLLVGVEHAAETLPVINEFARRHPLDEVALQPGDVAFAHRRKAGTRRLDAGLGMVLLGPGPLQDQHVIGAEFNDVEAQRRAAMRHDKLQIGAGPVGDRHEIVADNADACGGNGSGSRICNCRSAFGNCRCGS